MYGIKRPVGLEDFRNLGLTLRVGQAVRVRFEAEGGGPVDCWVELDEVGDNRVRLRFRAPPELVVILREKLLREEDRRAAVFAARDAEAPR